MVGLRGPASSLLSHRHSLSLLHTAVLHRIWDTHNVLQKTVVKPSTPSASRVGVSTVAYNSTGKLLAAGLADGTLQVRQALLCAFCSHNQS